MNIALNVTVSCGISHINQKNRVIKSSKTDICQSTSVLILCVNIFINFRD